MEDFEDESEKAKILMLKTIELDKTFREAENLEFNDCLAMINEVIEIVKKHTKEG